MWRSWLKGCLEFFKLFLKLSRAIDSIVIEVIRITIKLLVKYLACIFNKATEKAIELLVKQLAYPYR
jgi:hypothetical protein